MENKFFKHSIFLLTSLFITAFCLQAFSADTVMVVIDGEQIEFDVPPIVVEGRTLVPMRIIFEKLGAEVLWDGATKTVTGIKGSQKVVLKIGSDQGTINGETKRLDVPAIETSGRTLVPLRFISESFGIAVRWNGETNTVFIHSDVPFGTLNDDNGKKYIGEYKIAGNQKIPNGEGAFYSEQGKLIYQGGIQDARYHGIGTVYRENGTMIYQGDFVEGVPQGQGRYYKEDGTLQYEGAIVNNLPNGIGKEFFMNAPAYEGQFQDGVRFGYGKTFSEGKVTAEGEFDGDLIRGKAYYSDGAVAMEKNLVQGANGYNGTVKRYYPDGKILMVAEVVNNLATSNTKYYYKNGTIAYEGEAATRVTAKQLSDLIWGAQ